MSLDLDNIRRRYDVLNRKLDRWDGADYKLEPDDVESCISDVPALLAEVERLTAHSITLNSIGWKIAAALGEVPDGADAIVGNPEAQADRLIDAFDRERLRTEMMSYQRGAILDVLLRLNSRDAVDRIEEIFKAGMSAEVKAGYGDVLAVVEHDRDRLSDELAEIYAELRQAKPVLDAAQKWRAIFYPDFPASWVQENALIAAVDGWKNPTPRCAGSGQLFERPCPGCPDCTTTEAADLTGSWPAGLVSTSEEDDRV